MQLVGRERETYLRWIQDASDGKTAEALIVVAIVMSKALLIQFSKGQDRKKQCSFLCTGSTVKSLDLGCGGSPLLIKASKK